MLGLSPLASRLLSGEDHDLLAPLKFLAPGAIPKGVPAPVPRDRLARVLLAVNENAGHPLARELTRELAQPDCLVVVTGQQPGLLGGPLYTLTKAAAAVRWAQLLRERGQAAVPLFWMATEDHDFREVSQVAFSSASESRRLDLGADLEPLRPVGGRTLGPGIESVIQELSEVFPSPRAQSWIQELSEIYRPSSTFGGSFARLLVRLLGDGTPLLVDAMDPGLRALQKPLFSRFIQEREDVEEALASGDQAVASRDLPLQVRRKENHAPLFLIQNGERRRIQWTGGEGYSLRGLESSSSGVDDLLDLLEREPSRFSPSALSRPVIQDAILGSYLQILGPGELAYIAQSAPLYRALGVSAPWVALRPQALILDRKANELRSTVNLDLPDLLGDRQNLDKILAQSSGAFSAETLVAEVEALLEGARDKALTVSPDLARPWEKTRDQVLRALALFSQKTQAAAARRDEVTARRWDAFFHLARPFGSPQERVLSVGFFPLRFGDDFAGVFLDPHQGLDPSGSNLQILVP